MEAVIGHFAHRTGGSRLPLVPRRPEVRRGVVGEVRARLLLRERQQLVGLEDDKKTQVVRADRGVL